MKQLFYLCGLLLAASIGRAQDIHFSQFYETSIMRNPALTGIYDGDYKVTATYRNQWSSISSPYQTAMVSAEMRFPVGKNVTDFLSFGLLSYYDRSGSLHMQTLTAMPAINYSKSLSSVHHSFLSVGFTGGYAQRSYDPAAATFNNQFQGGGYSSSNPSGEHLTNTTINNWDAGGGISYSATAGNDERVSYYMGVAGYHFTQPKQSFFNNDVIKLQTKWNATIGATWKLNEVSSFQLHGNYMLQGAYSEIIVGGLLSWNKRVVLNDDSKFAIYGGAFYRYNDAIIPTLKVDFTDYSIAMSYDVNVSTLRAASALRGGYEVSFIIKGNVHRVDGTKSQTICPKFF